MAHSKFNPFQLTSEQEFNELALELFRHQSVHCDVYAKYLKLLNCDPSIIQSVQQIPCLPIEVFKEHEVKTGVFSPDVVFTSSGTSGDTTSKHYVKDVKWYERAFMTGFEAFYGSPEDWVILALLPAYLEREGSSLVYMAKELIEASNNDLSGFYLSDFQKLEETLEKAMRSGKKVLLLGVTFGLLDFAAFSSKQFPDVVVMETGGMKGRRKEMVRSEVHRELRKAFGVESIHSEYGMTELMSQAYSKGAGLFETPSWMKVLIREVDDPFSYAKPGKTGGVNIIDLANTSSCAFIATSDLGRCAQDGAFEIVGRFDHSDVRGCNLMVL
ncbi:MAG: acyl transferase [Flavobacteriales bacterium]|nr:acyl transferase [Flavobacteriales bacterium]MDG1779675.1 acyl transferase [Flavobacteriales bacterium]MDG2245627.1 acyl transferase [Flavobacteriales bacterium]